MGLCRDTVWGVTGETTLQIAVGIVDDTAAVLLIKEESTN